MELVLTVRCVSFFIPCCSLTHTDSTCSRLKITRPIDDERMHMMRLRRLGGEECKPQPYPASMPECKKLKGRGSKPICLKQLLDETSLYSQTGCFRTKRAESHRINMISEVMSSVHVQSIDLSGFSRSPFWYPCVPSQVPLRVPRSFDGW